MYFFFFFLKFLYIHNIIYGYIEIKKIIYIYIYYLYKFNYNYTNNHKKHIYKFCFPT